MINKILDIVPTKELYDDLFSPSMKKAGEALETIMDGANLILLPLKLVNLRSRTFLKSHLENYNEKLLETKSLAVTKVPDYVGLPIVDKLVYLDRSELSELFVNLLTKASFDETIGLVHPSFLSILNNLSTDEAKLLFELKNETRIPYIDIYLHKSLRYVQGLSDSKHTGNLNSPFSFVGHDFEDVKLKAAWNISGLENTIELNFASNIDLYLENLIFNGLIAQEHEIHLEVDSEKYDQICELYSDKIEKYKRELVEVENHEDYKFELRIVRKYFYFTEIGKMFLKACVNEIEENVV